MGKTTPDISDGKSPAPGGKQNSHSSKYFYQMLKRAPVRGLDIDLCFLPLLSNELVDVPERNAKDAIFMLCVGSIASVVGFGYTYLQAKKGEIQEITSHNTPQAIREQMAHMRDGTRLASRAFAYSWLWSIGGVGILSYCAWKLSGARDLKDFRQKAGESLPVIPKSENQGRNEFKSLHDLADYLEEEDLKEKLKSQSRSDPSGK